MNISDDEWFRIFQRLDKLDLQKSKSRTRIACSRKRKKSCINNLACHWITGKGCKRGKSKVSQTLKKSRRSSKHPKLVRRSRRGRPRIHARRSREAPRRSRRGRPRIHARRSRRSRRGRPRIHARRSRRSRRGRPRIHARRSRRSRRGRPRIHARRSRRSRRGRPRSRVACSRKRKQHCMDNLACHWIIGKGCKKT